MFLSRYQLFGVQLLDWTLKQDMIWDESHPPEVILSHQKEKELLNHSPLTRSVLHAEALDSVDDYCHGLEDPMQGRGVSRLESQAGQLVHQGILGERSEERRP